MSNPRLQSAFKSLALFGLAIFLYTRIVNGTLLFILISALHGLRWQPPSDWCWLP
ncbi:MAG: hypothetical protein R2911_09770 [Caldilineaceae bacterium]